MTYNGGIRSPQINGKYLNEEYTTNDIEDVSCMIRVSKTIQQTFKSTFF